MNNDYVSISVGHLVHVLLTVYNATEHVTRNHLVPCVAELIGVTVAVVQYIQ